MKNKIISIILSLTLMISVFPVIDIGTFTAKAADIFRWESYEYIINDDNTVTLTCYRGKSKQISVPSSINGMSVVKINDYCFSGDIAMNSSFSGTQKHPNSWYNKRIEKVVIPPSVKTIGKGAFQAAEKLQRVVLYDGLEAIEEYAFYKCAQLKGIELPDSLKKFTLYAFELTGVEELVLGPNINEPEIRDSEGTKVREITLNAESVSLGRIEISNNSALEEIVCNGTFLGVGSVTGPLKRIVCNGNVSYSVISDMVSKGFYFNYGKDRTQKVFSTTPVNGEKTYESDGYIYRINEKAEAVITQYVGDEVDIIIPSSLDSHTVTELAPHSFSKEKLVSVTIPDTVETIGECAFAYNTALENITFSPKIKSIPAECFIGCKSLKTLSLPENVKEIGENAFQDCKTLKSVEMNGILRIGNRAFYFCEELEKIGNTHNLKEIGDAAFSHCDLNGVLDLSLALKIGYRAFMSCDRIDEVILNDELTVLEGDTFWNCSDLKKINFPSELVSIGSGCFYQTKISTADFGGKLKEIGSSAFARGSLKGIIDVSSVEKIGRGAFGSNPDIEEVILCNNLTTLEYGTFQGCTGLKKINFPSELVFIDNYCFGGSGINSAVFGENLEEIGIGAFNGCHFLSMIDLPDNIDKIGSIAFQGTSIETLTIPENLSVIGYGAFQNCTKLDTVYFYAKNCTVDKFGKTDAELNPDNLIDSSPFYGCNIKNIYLGGGITSIGGNSDTYGTFENCESLEKIMIPDTVSKIGKASFKNCYSLELAVISDSVTSVADDAFEGCDNLTILCFEDSYIYEYAQNNGIAVSTFLVSPIPNQTYTGKKITPEVTVTFSGDTLHKYIDFGVTFANNINVGEADVTVKGRGDYKNFSNKTRFTIVTKDISSATISAIADQAWTGDAVIPELIVTDSSVILKEGVDYTTFFSDNKKEGTATVVVTGKGNYSGGLSAKFNIVKMTDTENFFSRLGSSIKAFFIRIGAFFKGIFTW